MVCGVCRTEYLASHDCPGPPVASAADGTAPPASFALFYYLKETWRIVRWDDAAIRRIAADPRALPYGLLVWALTNIFVYGGSILVQSDRVHHLVGWRVAAGAIVALVASAILGLLQIGICHLFAKWFFAGDGHFINLLRPLLFATIVYVFSPILSIVSALAWIAVVMMVFEEVHKIEPLTAFLLSAGVGLGIRIVEYLLTGHIF
jgi:hypothetical protein